jgi:hypothetical protein
MVSAFRPAVAVKKPDRLTFVTARNLACYSTRTYRSIVVVGIDPVDALVLDSADARTEAQAQHGEGGEVDLGIAVGLGIMLLDLELALVVKQMTSITACRRRTLAVTTS